MSIQVPPTDPGTDPLDALASRIRTRTATAAVVGLGYVGLPLLTAISAAGFPVIGVDRDRDKVEALQAGRSYIVDVGDSEVAGLARAEFDTDPASLARADVILLCLPTPLTDNSPDLTMVTDAAEDAARSLASGQLVIL